jgi:hypothetical protein
MPKGTIKTILILVSLLFLNIEAAHAGLVGKLKLYIHHEFSDLQLFYSLLFLTFFGFMAYVVFTPVLIGKKKWARLSYYSYPPSRRNYQSKRESIRKIEEILTKRKNAQ